MRRATSWALAVLAACALTISVLAVFAERNVFDSDGFAERSQQALQSSAVSADLARRLSDAAVRAEPDLVALRPLVTSAAEGVVRSAAFRSLVRAAARDVHRSVFDRDASTVTLTVFDTGVLLNEAIGHLRPDLARRIPPDLHLRLSGAAERAATQTLEIAERVRLLALMSLLAALALGAGAVLTARSKRDGVVRLGAALAVCGGLAALAAALAPHALTSNAAARALAATWLNPLATWCAALCGCGLVLALSAAAILRPVVIAPLLRRGGAALVRTPERSWARALRAVAAILAGALAILEPLLVIEVLVASVGLVLVLGGMSELLQLAAGPPAPGVHARRGFPRAARVAGLAAALTAGVAVTAFALAGDPEPIRLGRCNGDAALCDRTLDQVAFLGTHNSMAADGEPGWLFAAQDAGIPAQLREGVRALLIDTHYGFATPRGVATDIAHASKSRAKIVSEVGERFVDTAERLRTRIGYTGGGTREVFLCHAFCEVGATPAREALEGVHAFLLSHPEDVLILSIEDDTDSADTAKLIHDSGLIHEVYRGPAKPPWPTLRDMIERDERVLVLIENDASAEPWMHEQPAVAQETPYRFATPAELSAPTSCAPNRGGTAGSLLLVNHWVDTSPAPRKSIAREVNAPDFLRPRLRRCQTERGRSANIVAVDFYRQGNVLATVQDLNRPR